MIEVALEGPALPLDSIIARMAVCWKARQLMALLTSRVHHLALPLCVKVRAGDVLTVDAGVEGDGYRDVTLTGPAIEVFSGEIKL